METRAGSGIGRRGLSLLEVVLVAGILSAVAAPVLWSLLTSRHGFVASVQEMQATALAVRTIEGLKNLPFDRVPVSREQRMVADVAWNEESFIMSEETAPAGAQGTPLSTNPFELLGPPVTDGTTERHLLIERVPLVPGQPDAGPDLKRVTVLVQWSPAGAEEPFSRQVRLVALLAP